LEDRKYSATILDILDPNYFDDDYYRTIANTIKTIYEEKEYIPDLESVKIKLRGSVTNGQLLDLLFKTLGEIEKAEVIGQSDIQQKGMAFCKQQAMKKTLKKVEVIIESGDIDRYYECEELIRKGLDIGDNKDDSEDALFGIEEVVQDDFRNPIATGVNGLDKYMNGGLAKTELGVILAPTGVGKTTLSTIIANSAKNQGKNVLQIFFEDNPKAIKRKHLVCWHNQIPGIQQIDLNEVKYHKEKLIELGKQKKSEPGVILLKKFNSDGTTINKIKNYIRKLISQGFIPDLVILDYIDCVESAVYVDDNNVSEGKIMRQFETMLTEFDIAGWVCVQGNRSAISSQVVQTDQAGGSIKRMQIGHVIISIAKSLSQKESNTANMAILKSRIGDDGIIFEDCVFNNKKLIIDTTSINSGTSFSQFKENKKVSEEDRIRDLLNKKSKIAEEFSNNKNNN